MTTLVCNNDLALVTPLGDYETRRNYLDYMISVLTGAGKSTIKPPVIIKTIAARVQRAARSVRSSVRQTFAARKAAKAADDGGGSSDPDGRRPHTGTNTNNTPSPVSAFLQGGAK